MAFVVETSNNTGETLFAVARKISAAGVISDTWDVVGGAWDDPVTKANAALALVEGTGIFVGAYTAAFPTLGTYDGAVQVTIHDDSDANDNVIGSPLTITVVDGDPVTALSEVTQIKGSGWSSSTDTLEAIYDAAATGGASFSETQVVSDDRTFKLLRAADGTEAANVVQMTTDSELTLAFDFSQVLNPGTGIVSGSVTVTVGSELTIDTVIKSQDVRKLHADVTATTTGNRTLKASATSTDNQALSGTCHLIVY